MKSNENITISRSVLEQALEAFELHADQYPHMVKGYTLDAAEALRAALKQSPVVEQEPVAWMHPHRPDQVRLSYQDGWFPLYLHPQNLRCKSTQKRLATLWGYIKEQPIQPLTDEQIEDIWDSWYRSWTGLEQFETIVRLVEKHHGIGGEA